MNRDLHSAGMGWMMFCTVLAAGAALGITTETEHRISGGDADGKPSNPYFARTPYVLRWKATDNPALYWNKDKREPENSGDVMIAVTDVATGKIITKSGWVELEGELAVPVGGRHRIRVYSLGRWTASYNEDKQMIQEAAKRGELKDDVTVDDARQTSFATKKDRMREVKAALLEELEKNRKNMTPGRYDLLRADLERAAQLASSAEDLRERFLALGKASLSKVKQSDQETVKQPDSRPATAWDGKGLPPGMMKR